jgi:chromosome segregation ATPase
MDNHSYTYALTADPGKPLREAKETIVSLTGDVEMLNGIIKGLRQMLADVEPAKEMLEKDLNAAMEELRHHHELLKLVVDGAAQLRLERDEARREVCNMMHKTGFLNGDYADSRGWDCFPQEDKS